jgi:orotate phosphoribosyltransferase
LSKNVNLDECANGLASARARVIGDLREHALVIGEVTLTSGARASYYIDAKRAILRPDCFLALGRLLAHHACRLRASAVGGVPISAIPVACAALAASASELEHASADVDGGLQKAFIVRKEPKAHGLGSLIEGPPLEPGERCVVVEDVVTTGGSTVELLRRLRDQDMVIVGVISVLDRLAGGAAAIEAALDGPYVALTTIDDVYPERPDR